MGDEHKDTGTGWPPAEPAVGPPPAAPVDPDAAAEAATAAEAADRAAPVPDTGEPGDTEPGPDGTADAAEVDAEAVDADADQVGTDADQVGTDAGGSAAEEPGRQPSDTSARRRIGSAGLGIAVLLALLGFTFVVQVRSTTADALSSARQEDLVRILSDLEAQERRLNQEIARLEESQEQLASGAEGRQAALEEATRRADELGILAGTLPARGPGLSVRFESDPKPIGASSILNAVQELRGAGAEAMQISGGDGTTVRIIASTYFVDDGDAIIVSGRRLTGPYTITVIGDPTTMGTALNIPDGVVDSVDGDGGNVIVREREVVDVTALSEPPDLQVARPVS
jgi:uncharacterized protein YlxW (UPF0749 family)